MSPEAAPAEPRTIMVYSMGEVIGDGLIKLPFIAALRDAYPDAHIAWCAGKAEVGTVYAGPLKPIVAGCIDEILTAEPTGSKFSDHFGNPFGGRRFDLVIDTQSNLARSLFARRAARDFISPSGGFLLSRARPPKDEAWPETMLGRLARLLELARGRAVPLRPLPLKDPRSLAAARALLPDGPAYIGFAPGAGGVEKRWPLDRYIALARLAAAAGYAPVFFIGPKEAGEDAAIRAALPAALLPQLNRADDFADVDGPLLTIALAGRLKAAVANDAGPGHMLAAGGAPLLSLPLTRGKAAKFKPSASRLRQIVAEDFGGGMEAVGVEPVWSGLQALLAETGA
jgi:ADP-heptose:LPS heptosyltransferase